MHADRTPPLRTVILKVASRCNLNCTYCYVYNKEDQTWRDKPKFMSTEVFDAVLLRLSNHVRRSGQSVAGITFHGGEPLLAGIQRFRSWLERARHEFDGLAAIDFKVQTNGTLLNAEWISLFKEFDVNVGISLDGDRDVNDRQRIDHRSRGSYDRIVRGLKLLQDGGVPHGVLTVIQLGSDSLQLYEHIRSIGCDSVSFILPDFSHDNLGRVRELYGSTPCADYLIPIFDAWWTGGHTEMRIRNFWTILKMLMGGAGGSDTFGNQPFQFLVVEADGEIEGLDCLRACDEGITKTTANVSRNEFIDLASYSPFQHKVIFQGLDLPEGCRECLERDTCGGGYLPHRYSRASGFTNRSVWCDDILKLFGHIREATGFDWSETELRREALRQVSEEMTVG
jgi:uncharacterized protein